MTSKSILSVYVVFFILLGILLPVFSQAETLTLQQTIDQALQVNIDLQSQQSGTQAAIARKKASRTGFFPTFSASYQVTHDYESSVLYGIIKLPQDTYRFVGSVSQPLFAGFSIINQYDVAKLGLKMSELNENLTRQAVIFAAKQGYFSLLKAQKLLGVAELAVTQLEAHQSVAQNYYNVGMKPLNDVLKAQVELANAKQNLIVAQNGLEVAQSNLNLLLRRDINDPISITDMTSYTPFKENLDTCLKAARGMWR